MLKQAVFLIAVLGILGGSFAEVIEYKSGVNLTEITNSKAPSILLFGAGWCKPCTIMNSTIMNSMDDTLMSKQTIVFIDIDEYEDMYKKYGIQSIPTMNIYKSGKQLESVVGLQTETAIKKLIAKHSN